MAEVGDGTRWVDLGAIALRCRADGAGGPPLLLIHEMGGCLESWDRLVPALAPERLCLRYDQRGHGLSEKVRAMAFDALVADAVAVADAYAAERFVPVGCAVGGAVALAVAARHPARCPAVVATSPATVIPEARQAAARSRAEELAANGIRPGLEEALGRSYPPALRSDRATFDSVRAMRLGADPVGLAAMLLMLAGLDLGADLAAIRCPALVLAGLHDGDRPPGHVAGIAAAIPGATVRTVESGHFMALQAPGILAGEIRAFLAAGR